MPPLLADVVLPDGSVAAIFAVTSTLWTAIVLLWRNDQRRSNLIIRDLQRRLDRCQDELYRRTHGRDPPPLPPLDVNGSNPRIPKPPTPPQNP